MAETKRSDGIPHDADTYTRWPLQVGAYSYGWTVTVYDHRGHVRHLATADSEIQAFRLARKMARTYHIESDILVRTPKGRYIYPAAKLRD